MKPCDCKSTDDLKSLNEQGIGFNANGISLEPNSVIITQGPCTLKIPATHFKDYAEWFLTDQTQERDWSNFHPERPQSDPNSTR